MFVHRAAGLAALTMTTLLVAAPSAWAAPAALPKPDHVLIVFMENKDTDEVIGSSSAPWLNSLAHSGANFTNAHAETHPSQPNYIAMFSGSTQGVTDDGCHHSFDAPNLGSELIAAGKTFVGYAEQLPRAGSTTCTAGRYARKHSPWVNFTNLPAATTNLPASQLGTNWDRLPTVAFLTPDMCNDMHDCPVAAGDAWAKKTLGSYLAWAQTHNSMLVMTFDESETKTPGNPIPTIFAGPMVKAGNVSARVDHYSMLRTLEDMYGLKALGKSADAEPITGIWRMPTAAPKTPAATPRATQAKPAAPAASAAPAPAAPAPQAAAVAPAADAPAASGVQAAAPAPPAPSAQMLSGVEAAPAAKADQQRATFLGGVLINTGAATRAPSGVSS
ncbi:MAG: phosphatidylinositol-3-phosphatase [Pseudonocardiales bacterium]|nr:phosphatidylinositol-3-phosphatase [Pseudonocardiales bacterium]